MKLTKYEMSKKGINKDNFKVWMKKYGKLWRNDYCSKNGKKIFWVFE